MKKVLKLGIVVIMLSLIGCSKQVDEEFLEVEKEAEDKNIIGKKVSNEEFLIDLAIGLQKRWDIVNEITDNTSDMETSIIYMEGVEAELDAISKYKEKIFEDEKLGELGVKYIAALEKQKKAGTYEDDGEKFDELWEKGREARAEYLKEIDAKYNLYSFIEESYWEDLEDVTEEYKPIDSDKITNLDWEGLYTTNYANIKNYAFYVSAIDSQRKTGMVTMYSALDNMPDSDSVTGVLLDNNRLYFEYVDELHKDDENYTVKFIITRVGEENSSYTMTWVWNHVNESTDSNVYDLIYTFSNVDLNEVTIERQN